MDFIRHKPLAIALAVFYGGIALLGHGLHWLMPDAGHHHGLELVQCAVHGSVHHHHHATGECHQYHHHAAAGTSCDEPSDELSLTAGDCVAHAHQCEICVFLAQARSERLQPTAAVIRPYFVTAVVAFQQPSSSPTFLGWHTPRGPPILA